MTPPPYPIVLVVWCDPRGCNGWEDVDEFEPGLATCHTVGFLYVEGDPLTVVGSFSDTDQLSDATTIPLGCVRSVTVLAPAAPASASSG